MRIFGWGKRKGGEEREEGRGGEERGGERDGGGHA